MRILQLEFLQPRARLEPELVHQSSPRPLVGLERVRLPSRAIEREHQLPVQALAQRVLAHEPLELRHELGAAAFGQVGRDAVLEHAESLFLEVQARMLREGLVADIDERRAAPERERFPQLGGVPDRAPFLGQPPELAQIDFLRRGV